MRPILSKCFMKVFFVYFIIFQMQRQYAICTEDELLSHISEQDAFQHHGRCELITIQYCQNIEYNQTIMPNLFNHQKQSDAASALHPFFPLLKITCSPNFHFFLCSLYVPVCTVLDQPIPPCRSLCLSAKKGCEDLMNKFGFPWPDQLDCNKFPEAKNNALCVSKNVTSTLDESNLFDYNNPNGVLSSVLNSHSNGGYSRGKFVKSSVNDQVFDIGGDAKYHEFVCPYQFKIPKGYKYSVRLGSKVVSDCGLPCNEMFFNNVKRQFSKIWIGGWSVVCAVSCLFTVLTFLINTDRFRYPERPIIFLSLCYLMVSTIYIIGFLSGDNVACRKPFPPPSPESLTQMVSIISQGTKGEWCTILFIGLYFFSMASSIWWVILALTWFLAAGMKWGHEAIEANSQYFHLAAWAIPAIKTVTILAMGKVEGDILTGVCYVGIWDPDMLRGFVLAPLFIYLLLGVLFLLLGFISLFRIRTVMKHDGTKTDKLEKLMMRIGIFSMLYILPAITVIVCLFYEQANFHHWMASWQYDMCNSDSKHTYLISCPDVEKQRVDIKPSFLIFMLKYLMSFIVGITSSVWIWSSKTVSNWKELFYRIKGDRSSTHAYV